MIGPLAYQEWRVRRLRAKVNAERQRLEQENAELLAEQTRLEAEHKKLTLDYQFYKTLWTGGMTTNDSEPEVQ